MSIISATNSSSTSITLCERVSFKGGVSKSLVVTIVEGVAGAVVSATEEIGSSRGGVFMEISVLVTREIWLVTWDPAQQPALESLG